MLKPLRLAKATAFAICLVGLSGCATTPLNQVKQFGRTTSELSTNATDALNYLDRTEVQRKLHDVAANPNKGPEQSTFRPFFESSGAEGDDPKRRALELRLKLLRSISGYAEALEALASAEHYEQLDAAAADLNSALTGLSSTYQDATGAALRVTDADLGVLATFVTAVGRAKINKDQYEALRRIAPAADPYIKKSAELLANDLGAESELGRYAASAVSDIQIDMQIAYNRERKKPESRYDERLAQLERIERYHQASKALPPFFSAVSDSSRKMANAHALLSKALLDGSLGNANLAKSLAEFKVQVEAVKEFRASLEAAE